MCVCIYICGPCESAKWFELWRQDKLGWVMNLSKITACCRGYFPFDKWSGPSVRHDKSYAINVYLRNWNWYRYRWRYLGESPGRRERPGQKWIGKVTQVRILGIRRVERRVKLRRLASSGPKKKPVWSGSRRRWPYTIYFRERIYKIKSKIDQFSIWQTEDRRSLPNRVVSFGHLEAKFIHLRLA